MSKINKTKKSARNLTIFGAILIGFMLLLVVFIILQDPNKQDTSFDAKIDAPLPEISKGVADIEPEEVVIETVDNAESASRTIDGGNLITSENKVINEQGQVVQNQAKPMTALAPILSAPLDPNKLLDSVIKIEAYANGFSPREFIVRAGQPVTIALTSIGTDSRLSFTDESLAGLELPVPQDKTMAKTFSAPSTPGEYIFIQNIPGKYDQTGKMIVR